MVKLFTVILIALVANASAQNQAYTTANVHSHNDYEQQRPFFEAWENQFGSIEADIFLNDGELFVAHDSTQLTRRWMLDSLYLIPLRNCMERNGGYVYADTKRSLQLMIDIKSEAISTLVKLIEQLKSFKALTNASSLKIVVSGNRPLSSQFHSYPSWILFDGEMQKTYQPRELKKVEMVSDNFANYSRWLGEGQIPVNEQRELKQMIDKVHGLGKKIRFWNAPDTPDSWKAFIDMGVDYINTDKIGGLSMFLSF